MQILSGVPLAPKDMFLYDLASLLSSWNAASDGTGTPRTCQQPDNSTIINYKFIVFDVIANTGIYHSFWQAMCTISLLVYK